MPLGHLSVFFGNIYIDPLPIFLSDFLLLSSLQILDINPLLDMIYKYFLPFSRLPFHIIDNFLCCVETLVWCSPACLTFFLFLQEAFLIKIFQLLRKGLKITAFGIPPDVQMDLVTLSFHYCQYHMTYRHNVLLNKRTQHPSSLAKGMEPESDQAPGCKGQRIKLNCTRSVWSITSKLQE